MDVVFSSDRSGDRFTGKPVSQTTGLYYDYQRWYDPSIGRFISQDPLPGHKSNPQTLNPYVYVLDGPTSLTDPSGMDGGFLGPFDQYVSGPYLDWFNSNIEVPVLTFECGCNRAVVEEAVNQNAGLEKTLFDVGVVSGVVIASAAILTPYTLGATASTGLSTGIGACEEDPQACEPPPAPPEPTPPTITSTTGEGASDINPGELTTVRHYTSWVGRAGITQSGAINPSEDGFVYVTSPSEVEGLTTPQEIATRLGLPVEKAVTYYEFQYPSYQLENLGLTSGGAQQFGILGRVFLSQVGGNWWPAVPQ